MVTDDILEIIGFVLYLVTPIVFISSVSRAFLHGLAAARDPSHRLAPSDPRPPFNRCFRRKLRESWLIWGFGYVALIGLMVYFTARKPFSAMQFVNSLNLLGWLISMPLLMLAACIYWAPAGGVSGRFRCSAS